jgi:hypothetical protein
MACSSRSLARRSGRCRVHQPPAQDHQDMAGVIPDPVSWAITAVTRSRVHRSVSNPLARGLGAGPARPWPAGRLTAWVRTGGTPAARSGRLTVKCHGERLQRSTSTESVESLWRGSKGVWPVPHEDLCAEYWLETSLAAGGRVLRASRDCRAWCCVDQRCHAARGSWCPVSRISICSEERVEDAGGPYKRDCHWLRL